MQIRSFTLSMSNFEVVFSRDYSVFSMQGYFLIFHEGSFLYRLRLRVIGTCKSVA